MNTLYKVCIPKTRRDFFDYLAQDFTPAIGTRVWVPFGKKKRIGIIVGIENASLPDYKLRHIEEIIDTTPILPPEVLSLCFWVSHYYQSPLSEVLLLALPKNHRLGKSRELPQERAFVLNQPAVHAHQLIKKQAHRQHALIDFLATATAPVRQTTLIEAGFKQEQWRKLIDVGLLDEKPLPTSLLQPANTFNPSSESAYEKKRTPVSLNSEQLNAVDIIKETLHSFQCYLLQGVTGSGKTEVYLEIINELVSQGKQALVLVPEIGLTPQLVARFNQRFAVPIITIHSHLNDKERQIAWTLAAENQAKIIIGTRTAVFTPMPELGLIVIDEEHDASFKQMNGVHYSARDTALIRAQAANIPIILGSATPSIESLHNAETHKFKRLSLTQKALNTTPLFYQLIDIRNQALQHGLAKTTLSTIDQHLNDKNQVLVFINRRGFAPVFLCHQCGWIADCSACDSHLTLHLKLAKLICHHCGRMKPMPKHCASCHSHELIPVGAGTQRIYDYLSQQFPHTNTVRIDRDVMNQKNAFAKQLRDIQAGRTQLIIGTQMLAKGHHFPNLSLVVILDADHGLFNQDFRGLERLGQLIVQVSGRAGRAHKKGSVLIQTHHPHHPLLNLLIQQGYEAFAQAIRQSRLEAQLPPYHFLALIRAKAKHLRTVLTFLHQAKVFLQPTVEVLGPAPAPLARKSGLHRMQLLIKSPSRQHLQQQLSLMRKHLAQSKAVNVQWNIDVDPVDLA